MTELKGVDLNVQTFVDFNMELVVKTGLMVVKIFQTFYTKSLGAFDKVLETLVQIRNEQKAKGLETGEAYVNMFKAIAAMDVPEDASFVGVTVEFLSAIETISKDTVKDLYKLSKKHPKLQQIMEIHEDATVQVKKLFLQFADTAQLKGEEGHLIAEMADPLVTVVVLGSIFGFL